MSLRIQHFSPPQLGNLPAHAFIPNIFMGEEKQVKVLSTMEAKPQSDSKERDASSKVSQRMGVANSAEPLLPLK